MITIPVWLFCLMALALAAWAVAVLVMGFVAFQALKELPE